MRPSLRSSLLPLRYPLVPPESHDSTPTRGTRKRKASGMGVNSRAENKTAGSEGERGHQSSSDGDEAYTSVRPDTRPGRLSAGRRRRIRRQKTDRRHFTAGNTEKTYEQYQEEAAAEARELEGLAKRPMSRVHGRSVQATRTQGELPGTAIKQETYGSDDDQDISAHELHNEDNERPPVFVKPSIEEEDVKLSMEELEDGDMTEEDSARAPDQLQEIDAATFAPSRSRRDEADMMAGLGGMDIGRPARAARSVAPRDLSARRLSSKSFAPRYQGRTVTRSQYKDHLTGSYGSDVEAGELGVQQEVLANRKRQRDSAGKLNKVPYGTKSNFQIAVDAKILVKERVKAAFSEDEDMED